MAADEDLPLFDESIDLSKRYPFGVGGLDARFGGVPSGTLVHLAGHPDAGVYEYVYTSLAGVMEATHSPDAFQERTGFDPSHYSSLPESVRYISLRSDRRVFERAVRRTVGDERAAQLIGHTTFEDFTDRYLACTQLPDSITEQVLGTTDIGCGEFDFHDYGYRALLSDLFESFLSATAEELVVVDSLGAITDLEAVGLSRSNVLGFIFALSKFATNHDIFTYLLDLQTADTIAPSLLSVPTGRLYFSYDSHDIDLRQYLRVGTFNGMLGTDEQIKFRTRVTDGGFVVKDSRTIMPSERRY